MPTSSTYRSGSCSIIKQPGRSMKIRLGYLSSCQTVSKNLKGLNIVQQRLEARTGFYLDFSLYIIKVSVMWPSDSKYSRHGVAQFVLFFMNLTFFQLFWINRMEGEFFRDGPLCLIWLIWIMKILILPEQCSAPGEQKSNGQPENNEERLEH